MSDSIVAPRNQSIKRNKSKPVEGLPRDQTRSNL